MEDSLESDPFSEGDLDELLDELSADHEGNGPSKPSLKSPQSSKSSSAVSDSFKSPAKSAIKSPKSPDVTSAASIKETPKKVTFGDSTETAANDGETAAIKTADSNRTRASNSPGKDSKNSPSPKPGFGSTISGSPSTSGLNKSQPLQRASPDPKKPRDSMTGRRPKDSLFSEDDLLSSMEKSGQEIRGSFMDIFLKGDEQVKPTSKEKISSFDEKLKISGISPKRETSYTPSEKKAAPQQGKSGDPDFSDFPSFSNEDGERKRPGRRPGRRGGPTSENLKFLIDDSDITGKTSIANLAPAVPEAGAKDAKASRTSRGGGSAQRGPESTSSAGPSVSSGDASTHIAGARGSSAGGIPFAVSAMPALYSLDASFEEQSQQRDAFLQRQQQTGHELQLQLRRLENQFTQQAQQQTDMMQLLSKQRDETVCRLRSALQSISSCSLPGELPPPDASAISPVSIKGTSADQPGPDARKELDKLVLEAQNEVHKLSSELEALQAHHKQEVDFLVKSYEDKLKLRDDLYEQKEKLLKRQNEEVVQHHKEVLELQKQQHEQQLQDVQKLRDLEVSAAERSAARNAETSSVVQQLSSNTAQLSELSAALQQQGDAAQQVLQQALDAQKQQVRNLEAELSASKRAADAEQERLTVLVCRLEERLTTQQAALEENTWRLQRKEKQLQEDVDAWQKKKETEQGKIADMTADLERQRNLLEQKMIKLKVQESLLAVGKAQREEEVPAPDEDLRQGIFEERLKILAQETKKIHLHRKELSAQRAHLDKIKDEIERDKFEVSRSESSLQTKLEMLQQEQRSLAVQRQQQASAVAALDQKLSKIHAATEAAHVLKLAAAQVKIQRDYQQLQKVGEIKLFQDQHRLTCKNERDRAESAVQKLREQTERGLCSLCGQVSVGVVTLPVAREGGEARSAPSGSLADNFRSTSGHSALGRAPTLRRSSVTEVDYRPEAVLARLNARAESGPLEL